METLKLLPLILALSSCAAPRAMTYTDPEFLPYLQDFELEYALSLPDYPINFAILPTPRIAQCGFPHILVDPKMWAKFSPQVKKVIIYHELGHCVFHRDHDSVWITDDTGERVPRSIMHPTMSYKLGFERNWQYYKDELVENRIK